VAEVFGARTMIFLKDVDGLYTADPRTNPSAQFIAEISASELIARNLGTLPIDRAILDLLARAKLAKKVQIVNGLVPGNLTRALSGEAVGTTIHA
jgi:molybdenum storage protein